MKMKKTWLSYLLWLIYAFAAVVLFAVYLSGIGAYLWETDKYAVVAFACAGTAAAACIWFLGRKTAEVLAGRFLQEGHSKKVLGYFLPACVLAASIFYRIHGLRFLDTLEHSLYYDMAWIKSPGGIPEIAHGASYCYTVLLSAVLSFSGNTAMAGVFLQIVLQALSLWMLYSGIRLLAGEAEALCTMAFMAFLPAYAGQIYSLTPEVFYFFLFTAGIWGIGLCRKRSREGKQINSTYIIFLLMGIYIGALGYLDAIGFVLLLFAGGICVGEAIEGKSRQKGTNRETGKGNPGIFLFFLCLSAALSAAFLCLIGDAALTGNPLTGIWNTWLEASGLGGSVHLPVLPERDAAAGAVLCFSGMLGIAGFWFHKEQKQDIWILYLLIVTGLNMIAGEGSGYPVFITLAWAILAGAGIASMGRGTEEAVKTAVPELVLEDMDKLDEEEGTEEKPKIKLIENPLPLPKKHVKREMDFDRIVEWEKMKYDILVDEADDFDI